MSRLVKPEGERGPWLVEPDGELIDVRVESAEDEDKPKNPEDTEGDGA